MANPITREEKILNAIANRESLEFEPITREEQYLAHLAGIGGKPEKPITRKEMFLDKIELWSAGDTSGGGVVTGTYTTESDMSTIDLKSTSVTHNLGRLPIALLVLNIGAAGGDLSAGGIEMWYADEYRTFSVQAPSSSTTFRKVINSTSDFAKIHNYYGNGVTETTTTLCPTSFIMYGAEVLAGQTLQWFVW